MGLEKSERPQNEFNNLRPRGSLPQKRQLVKYDNRRLATASSDRKIG